MACWSPAHAGPLSFGPIHGDANLAKGEMVENCVPLPAQARAAKTCTLPRATFGGLLIDRAAVELNSAGRVRSLTMLLDRDDYDLAYRLLKGRYGAPTSLKDFPRWTRFYDGETLSIRKGAANTAIAFDFPENAEAAPEQSSGPLWYAVLLLALAVAAGLVLYRRYRARGRKSRLAVATARRGAQVSMRETLERRLREGRDLRF
ncbi:MAG TPA: hypothetical protein VE567_02295 [Sphingomonas sp.]|nr:hypothetical protein [Sphingomonas sp.]